MIVSQLVQQPPCSGACHRKDEIAVEMFKIQDYFIISSQKLKRGGTLTTSQYTITHILYFKIQRTVIENTEVT